MAKVTKITNISRGPRGAYLKGELVEAQPGETIEADDWADEWFTVGEVTEDDDELTHADQIKAAIGKLDPEDDDHWTNDGLPAVDAVAAILDGKVTRKQIDAAAPGFMRPDPTPV